MPQGKRLTIDEFLKRPAAPQPKSVSIDEFLTRPVLPPQPQESYYQQLKRNLGMGFEQLGQKVSDVAAAGYEIGSGLLRGDTRPLKETAELAARGAAPIAAAFSNPYFAPQAYLNTAAEQRQPIAEVERQRAQRREDAGGVYFRGSAIENAKLAERAAQDPSLLARIERSLPQLLPYIGAAAASGGSAPVLAATGAVMELNEPQNIPISAALSSLPIPSAKTILRPILSRIRGAESAAERIESAAAKATMEGTGPAAVQRASTTVTQPVDALQSAFAKLGTENADDISAMIFNANRRFNSPKSITPEERAAAIEDFNKVVKLTPDEEHALAQVLPEYSYNPVNAGYTGAGRYERQISDIPNAEPNAQLDANLRQLEQFFGSEGRATAPGIAAETGPPAISEAPAMSVGASAARGPSASVSGPRADIAAMEVAGQPAVSRPVPPGAMDEAFAMSSRGASQPIQQPLFDAAAKSKWQDTVLAYYRANFLTAPLGRANDLGNTVINQFADAAVRPIAAAVDVVVSKLTGARSITGPSLRGTARAFGSLRQGLRDAGEVLRTGRQAIESGADDAIYGSEIRSGLGKAFDVPVNGVFRILGALDAPFRRFGFTRNLYDRAKVVAINEGKYGGYGRNQIEPRTIQLMDRPDIIAAAVRDGEKAVFSDPSKFTSLISSLTRNSPNARLMLGLAQPFMRIPLKATLKTADFAGLGGVKMVYKIARGLGRKAGGKKFFSDLEDQRVFSQNVAAGSFAIPAFLLGMELHARGKLEGFFYTSPKDYPNGKTPTSVEIGGTRYNVNRLGGFIAAPLFVGATYDRLRKQDVGKAEAFLRSFTGLLQQAPVVAHYGIIPTTARAVTDPATEIPKQAGNIGMGFIPASGAVRAFLPSEPKNTKKKRKRGRQ